MKADWCLKPHASADSQKRHVERFGLSRLMCEKCPEDSVYLLLLVS